MGNFGKSKVSLISLIAGGFYLAGLLAGCASSDTITGPDQDSQQVRLVAHDSFVVTDEAVEQLRQETGIELVIINAGDTGSLVGNALLNTGSIGADVLFGIDDVLLPRALDAGVFIAHGVSSQTLVPEFAGDTAGGLVMPIDYGDVCLNIDRSWYAARGVPAPATLQDFTKPEYKGHLVVPDPASSSPGLAFLLATIDRYGEGGFVGFWQALKANDVLVVGDWTQAYVGNFTAGGGGGEKPAVVSYATSPPAEIIYAAEPKPAEPKSFALTDGCYRQVEFAGVLSGAKNTAGASKVIAWLISESVQNTVAETMFVLPVRQGVILPDLFERFATKVARPITLEPKQVAAKQSQWLNQWAKVMTS